MKLINMTPFDLKVYDKQGNLVVLPPSGRVLDFIEQADVRVQDFDEIGHVQVATIRQTVNGQVPDKTDNVGYVVPLRTLLAMQEEGYDVSDFYAPNMLVRDGSGKIAGARRLMQVPNRDS